jgi:rhodanese-related sulfurtransferase
LPVIKSVVQAIGLGAYARLDVRQPQEWAEGPIENARHITGAELPERFPEILESKNKYRPHLRDRVSLIRRGKSFAKQGYKYVASIIGFGE